jgi:hypothetical protein
MSSLQKADHLAATANGNLRSITDNQDITELHRVDPDPEIFEVPAGFRLESPIPTK